LSRTERWVGVVFVALALIGAPLNTKLLFVAGIVLGVVIGIGIAKAIIQQFRQNPRGGIASRIVEAVPLSMVLLLDCVLVYLFLQELLRARPR